MFRFIGKEYTDHRMFPFLVNKNSGVEGASIEVCEGMVLEELVGEPTRLVNRLIRD